jgi:hypothetical protein
MMQPPASRYKVVERGRRLEVIDTRTGKPASSSVRVAEPERSGKSAGAGIDADAFFTKRWYDDKAPRRIRLNFVNRQRLLSLRWGIAIAVAILVVLSFLFWPLAVLLVVALAAGPKLRAQIRVASTRWLDGLDQ